jgi:hypothetical protein
VRLKLPTPRTESLFDDPIFEHEVGDDRKAFGCRLTLGVRFQLLLHDRSQRMGQQSNYDRVRSRNRLNSNEYIRSPLSRHGINAGDTITRKGFEKQPSYEKGLQRYPIPSRDFAPLDHAGSRTIIKVYLRAATC